MNDSNYKSLVKYSYDTLAKNNLPIRYIFDDFKYLDIFNSKLESSSKILDVGCGSGVPIAKYFIDKGHKVTGIDISAQQISLANKNLPAGDFIVMDMDKITLPENSFHGVICFYSLFHLPRIYHSKILKSFNSLIRSGGYLMITIGIQELEKIIEDYEDIKLYISQWGKEKNFQLLQDAGFSVLYENLHKVGNEEHLIVIAKKKRKLSIPNHDILQSDVLSKVIYQRSTT